MSVVSDVPARSFYRVPTYVMHRQTNCLNDRNIYVHPNPIARAIFWQRLSVAHQYVRKHTTRDMRVLDFGGGSGAFLPSLCNAFPAVSVLDLDLSDARRLATYYGFRNVRFYEQDMSAFTDSRPYDVLVATDVLEHFEDQNEPFRFIEKTLRPGGVLLLTLPTENGLYNLGRKIVRKAKPADHYHSAAEIVDFYCGHGYSIVESCHVPRLSHLAAPLFFVGVLVRGQPRKT